MFDTKATPERVRLVSGLADIISKQCKTFSDANDLDVCPVAIAVAAQLMDDLMEAGHAPCALFFANALLAEAKQRAIEELTPEDLALLKSSPSTKEH